MIPNNVLQRTFQIRVGDETGTAFALDVDGRQYLVTARHLLKTTGSVEINLHQAGAWRSLKCEVVGYGRDNIDITVLAPLQQLAHASRTLHPTAEGLSLGQDLHFLGFPYGFRTDVPYEINADFPLPLVRKACLSMFALTEPTGRFLILDGINNPGFSGGPVVFKGAKSEFIDCVTAVISGYQFEFLPVLARDADGNYSPVVDKDKVHGVKTNTGLVVAYSIIHVLEMIAANPIGFVLPQAA